MADSTRRRLLAGLLGIPAAIYGNSAVTAASATGDSTERTELPNRDQPYISWPSPRGGFENRGTRGEFAPFEFPLTEQWRVDTDELTQPVVAAAGVIVTVESSSQVTGYEELSGEPIWQITVDASPATGPVIGHRTVVVALESGTVLAVEIDTGERRWQTTLETSPTGAIVAGTSVYVTGTDAVVALAIDDGTVRWRLSHDYGTLSSPTLAEETLVVHDTSRRVLGIRDEEVVWEESVAVHDGGPPVRTDVGVVVLGGGIVTSLDPVDGSVQWNQSVPERSPGWLASRAGFTTMTGDNQLVTLSSLDGEMLSTEPIEAGVQFTSHQVLTPNYALLATRAPDVQARDLLSGEQVWQADLDGISQLNLLLGPHKLLCTVDESTLVCFQTPAAVPVQEALAALRDRLQDTPEPVQATEALRGEFGTAVEAYIDGDFETAIEYVEAAESRLTDRLAAYDEAVTTIETLELELAEFPVDVDLSPAPQQLETAREQVTVGEFTEATETAEAGLDVLEGIQARVDAAEAEIQQLEAEIDDAVSDGLEVTPAKEALAAARSAFEEGAFETAQTHATDGRETLAAIKSQAVAAEEAIETAVTADTRHSGIGDLAARLGYETELAAAEQAYEAGDYEAAEQHAQNAYAAYRIAALIVDGTIGGSMIGVILYKLRPEWVGRPVDRIEGLLPEGVDTPYEFTDEEQGSNSPETDDR